MSDWTAHLSASVLKRLGISIAEYWYLDEVYYLSTNRKNAKSGYCYKSIESFAEGMNLSKNGIIKMRDRLIERGLLKKNRKGYVKTTEMYHKVVRGDKPEYYKVDDTYHNVVSDVLLSGTGNIHRDTENIEDRSIDGPGKAEARRRAAEIRAKVQAKTKR